MTEAARKGELLKTEELTFLARRADGSECEVRPQFRIDASGAFCDLLWEVVWKPWSPEDGLQAALQILEREGEIALSNKSGMQVQVIDIPEQAAGDAQASLRYLWEKGFRP